MVHLHYYENRGKMDMCELINKRVRRRLSACLSPLSLPLCAALVTLVPPQRASSPPCVCAHRHAHRTDKPGHVH